MYSIISGKYKSSNEDYVFKDFNQLYAISDYIYKPLSGLYNIAVLSKSVDEVINFISKADAFDCMNISIYINPAMAKYIAMYYPNVKLASEKKPLERWIELLEMNRIYLEDNLYLSIYSSLYQKTEDYMQEAISILKVNFGDSKITKDMASKYFIFQEIVYPRDVLLSYLWHSRSRHKKLRDCLSTFSTGYIRYSMYSELNKLLEEKTQYYDTGVQSKLSASINTMSLLRMLEAFAIDVPNNDIRVTLYYYERS